jgi:hypothetical protein
MTVHQKQQKPTLHVPSADALGIPSIAASAHDSRFELFSNQCDGKTNQADAIGNDSYLLYASNVNIALSGTVQ